ncbi:MAG: sodium:solute symporter family protein [Planctomycetaceae bacterium]|nr:MAG: sodium:solute symporter family protein [Planctomycetaceae bacterium]
MFGVSWIDWLVIALYLAIIAVIGISAARRVRNSASFFIGDRKFGKLMMMFFTFGTGTHSDQAVSVAAKTYHSGASGIWYQWLWLFVTPFFWLLAPVFRRMRAVTTGDYFFARYDRSVAGLYAVMGMLQLTVNIGVMLKGSTAMITAVSGGQINPNIAICAMTAIFIIYGIAGGLSAAILTDFVQGILTIVLSFLILPFALSAVGGMAGLRESIQNPDMFKVVAPAGITAFYIAVISFNALLGWVTQPHNMGLAAAGKTEMEGRVGVMCGILFKRVCTIAWVLTGLCAVGLYAGQNIDVDHVYGLMAHTLLPKIAPGLVGLFIASMLAAVMSSCDAFMVSSSALFTENIYRSLLVKNKPDKHYTIVGRVVAGIVVVAGVSFAFSLDSVVQGLEIFWKVSAMMAIPFWLGLFWRRASSKAAWISTLLSFAVLLFTSRIEIFGNMLWDFNASLAGKLPAFMLFEGKLYLPWQMILYISAGFTIAIVVSLVTKPVEKKKLDRFYECLRTPIAPGEPETVPFTLPDGVVPAPRRPWFQHPDFEISRPKFVDIIGFIAGWAAVAILIGSFLWIIKR